jgi:hypothetical protein
MEEKLDAVTLKKLPIQTGRARFRNGAPGRTRRIDRSPFGTGSADFIDKAEAGAIDAGRTGDSPQGASWE